MNEMLISVIIPIYNSEKHLDDCLKSVINQTYKNIEIVCINDGSTDSSSVILSNYSNMDDRIKIYNKKNGGVSEARNMGIEKSKGEYIMFLDSDDYIDSNYIMELVSNLDNADMIKSSYIAVNNNNQCKKTIFTNISEYVFDISYPKELCNHLKTFEYNSSCCRLIRKRLIDDNNIRFDKSIKYGEDMLFSFECYMKSSKVLYINNYGYYYVSNDDSAMHNIEISALEKYLYDNKKTTDIILEKYNIRGKEKRFLLSKTFLVFERIVSIIPKKYDYKFFEKIIKKELLDYKIYLKSITFLNYVSLKNKISFLLLKCRLFHIYYFLKK